MKSSFIIFFTVVFTVYGLVNFYIFIRGWQALQQFSSLRLYYSVLFVFFAFSWLAGRIIENYNTSVFSDVLIWTGSFWLGGIVYFLLIILLSDITRLTNRFYRFLPENETPAYLRLKAVFLFIAIAAVSITVFLGYLNARSPIVRNIEIKLNKKAGSLKSLNIALASDIHLGTIINSGWFSNIVDRINGLNPDIVLLAGDILDEDVKPVVRHNLGEKISKINSKYGTYGITGNHEYIGGAEEACKYLEEHGVKMLRDTCILIDGSFYLAGREDRDIKRFAGKDRKSLSEIIKDINKNLPLIVMNHQPYNLDEAEKENADLHLSGHTHHGQMFPFNFITERIYEISRGYRKRGNTHFYVSNGAGTWGPPVRTGNRPEIVNIKLIFAED